MMKRFREKYPAHTERLSSVGTAKVATLTVNQLRSRR